MLADGFFSIERSAVMDSGSTPFPCSMRTGVFRCSPIAHRACVESVDATPHRFRQFCLNGSFTSRGHRMSATLILHAGRPRGHPRPTQPVRLPPARKPGGQSVTRRFLTLLANARRSRLPSPKMRLGVSHEPSRFLQHLISAHHSPRKGAVALAVGLRSSWINRSHWGSARVRTLVCDNLAFRSDLMVKRKHTVNGADAFLPTSPGPSCRSLRSRSRDIADPATPRVHLTDAQAESFMLPGLQYSAASIAQRQLPLVFREWHWPDHEAFRSRTAGRF